MFTIVIRSRLGSWEKRRGSSHIQRFICILLVSWDASIVDEIFSPIFLFWGLWFRFYIFSFFLFLFNFLCQITSPSTSGNVVPSSSHVASSVVKFYRDQQLRRDHEQLLTSVGIVKAVKSKVRLSSSRLPFLRSSSSLTVLPS